MLASRDDPRFRKSVVGLAISTAIGVGLLVGASFADGALQGGLWALALALDMGGPYFFGADGWKLAPHHFAERHGLIIIIALGESIVAVGVGRTRRCDLGIAVAAARRHGGRGGAVVAVLRHRRDRRRTPARERRGRARAERDGARLLLLPALPDGRGDRARRARDEEDAAATSPTRCTSRSPPRCSAAPRSTCWAHVAFRYRHVHSINTRRLGLGVLLCAFIPVAVEVAALATISVLAAALVVLIVVETRSYGDTRDRLRHELRHERH